MKREIWKYTVSPGEFRHMMPAAAEVLTVQMQRGEPQMWALGDPGAPRMERRFVTLATGEPIYGTGRLAYIGSFQPSPSLVFHLFEVHDAD